MFICNYIITNATFQVSRTWKIPTSMIQINVVRCKHLYKRNIQQYNDTTEK